MKNKKTFPFLLLSTVILAGCGGSGDSNVSSSSTSEEIEDPIVYNDVRKADGYKADLASLGEPKILVIPVDFSDYTCETAGANEKKNKTCNDLKKDIEDTFFGKSEDLHWESLASYYDKSSYGKLHLSGEVTDWYRATLTTVQAAQKDDNGISILRDAVEWARSRSENNLQDFDSDGDGYIDAVELVYSCPMNFRKSGIPSDSKFFWAFTFWDMHGAKANVEAPIAFSYVWASCEFMYEDKGNTKVGDIIFPDAHTFIHETGHLLGAPDYYTYDESTADWGAAGGLDMMDFNIGDHNAYTKTNYGWTAPKVVTAGTEKVTIRPFESSGDCIVVVPEWKGTMMNEYLIIEYYTPTGLNEKDSLESFAGGYPKTFTEAGIKVYHVDSRLAKFRYNRTTSTYDFVTYTSLLLPSPDNTTITRVGNSNTASRSAVKENKLIHLLEASGENSFATKNDSGRYANVATNDTLWKQGMTFGQAGGVFNAFKFNDGKIHGKISFVIDSITGAGATISFTVTSA